MSVDVYQVVKKLIGPIDPVGETHTDNHRFANLEATIQLVEMLHIEIDIVAYKFKDRQEASMKRAAERATKYLDDMGIED